MTRPTQAKYIFMTKGAGIHTEKIGSFEMALRAARIHPFNLVSVSSILPPHVRLISLDDGLSKLFYGDIVFTVLSRNQTNKQGQWISSGIGWIKPTNENTYGYISEAHLEGSTIEETTKYVENLAAELLSSCYGLDYTNEEWERAWNPQTKKWTIGEQLAKTDSVVAMGRGEKDKWVTTVAAAVFVTGLD